MKIVLFIILWTVASFSIGLVIFAVYAFAIDPFPPHADPTLPEVQHQGMRIGLVSLIFVFVSPIVVLILGICGVLPGTRRRKDLVPA